MGEGSCAPTWETHSPCKCTWGLGWARVATQREGRPTSVCSTSRPGWSRDAPFLQAGGTPGPRTPPWLTHPPAGEDQESLPPEGGTCWTSPRGSEPWCVTRGRGRNLPQTRGPTQPAGRLWDVGRAHLAWGMGEPQTLHQKHKGDNWALAPTAAEGGL